MSHPKSGGGGLILIGVSKLLKGLFIVAIGFACLGLLHKDVTTELYRWAETIHVDPENRFFEDVVEKTLNLGDADMRHAAEFAFAYAAIFMIEGVGLLCRQYWAEWMTVIVTGSFIPIEVWHFVRHPSIGKGLVVLLNVAIFVYLIRMIRRQARHPELLTKG